VSPETFPRRILFLVMGLSPQVVTETLYALARRRVPPFIPTEIHVQTTKEGAERARLTLLSREPGWFYRLCREYRMSGIRFSERDVQVIGDDEGAPLDDIRTERDNALAADSITRQIAALTRDDDAALHVSIAGGRKTMGFYAGYALSLFGRPQDRLSHVLVSPPFESNQAFFYPTRDSRIIYTPPPENRPLDTRDAEVVLAEIPFVRLRGSLPPTSIAGSAPFAEAVAAAQAKLEPAHLTIDIEGRRIAAGGTVVALPPAALSFLAWIADRHFRGETALASPPDGAPDAAMARQYLTFYRRCAEAAAVTRAARVLQRGMDKSFFEQHKSKLNRRLRNALGEQAAAYLVTGFGRRPHTTFGLGLPAGAIRFGEATAASEQTSTSR
jgi:CRISPR-associated protein (TIGR02584 family)